MGAMTLLPQTLVRLLVGMFVRPSVCHDFLKEPEHLFFFVAIKGLYSIHFTHFRKGTSVNVFAASSLRFNGKALISLTLLSICTVVHDVLHI